MGGLIPDSFIEELLGRLDIVEIIERRVPLKKAGREFHARCPFHDEKTPSFTVSPQKQFYHCFGCGAGGDVFSFLMQYEGRTFSDAVRIHLGRLRHDIALPARMLVLGLPLAIGISMFFLRKRFESVQSAVQKLAFLYPSTLFKTGLEKFLALSDRVTRLLQNGSLGYYLITIFSVVLTSLWIVVLTSHSFKFNIDFNDFNIIDFSIAVLMIIASLAVVKSRSRLASAASQASSASEMVGGCHASISATVVAWASGS